MGENSVLSEQTHLIVLRKIAAAIRFKNQNQNATGADCFSKSFENALYNNMGQSVKGNPHTCCCLNSLNATLHVFTVKLRPQGKAGFLQILI